MLLNSACVFVKYLNSKMIFKPESVVNVIKGQQMLTPWLWSYLYVELDSSNSIIQNSIIQNLALYPKEY